MITDGDGKKRPALSLTKSGEGYVCVASIISLIISTYITIGFNSRCKKCGKWFAMKENKEHREVIGGQKKKKDGKWQYYNIYQIFRTCKLCGAEDTIKDRAEVLEENYGWK